VKVSNIPFGTTDWSQVEYTPGMSYQVADQAEAHRSSSTFGATLFIVD